MKFRPTARLLVLFVVGLWSIQPAAAQECFGDLDGDGQVEIADLVRAANALLNGCPPPGQTCPGDFNHDDRVTVDEVTLAVANAINGCTTVPPSLTTAKTAVATDLCQEAKLTLKVT
ncbi:MAG: hypothetical protein ABI629_11885, partial [bacterium]